MARTVKVGLDVDEKPFVKGMGRAADAADKLDDKLDDVGESAKDTATGTDRAKESVDGLGDTAKDTGRELDRLRGDAARLDRQIDETAASVRDLARAIAATSDEAARADLNKKLSVEQGRLRERVNLRKLIDVDSVDSAATDLGAELAQGVSVSFAGRLGPLLARAPMAGMNPAVAAIGAPLAAGITAFLGTAIAGAIVGAAGVGGVVGGLVVASKHSAVKSAATALGDEFEATMETAAVGFVPAAVQGIGVLRSHLGEARDDLESIFANSSRFVVPLAEGAGQAVRSVLGGVRDLVEQADPVIDSIADGMVRIGDAAGDGLSSLADNAESGGRALSVLFLIVEQGVRGFTNLVNLLAETWELMEIGGATLSGNLPQAVGLIGEMALRTDEGGESNTQFAQSLLELVNGFQQEEDAADAATRAMREYADAADRIVDQNLDAAEATLRYRDSLREAKDAAEKGKRVTDDESEALIRLARDSNTLTDSLEQQGATTGELAERNQQARADFIATAVAMGHSRRRAEELADQYLKVPRKVTTEIEADTDQAARNLREVRSLIAQIRSKRVVITTQHNQIVTRSEGRNVPIGDVGGRRWGGITEHAQWGVLREAQIVAPVAPARYAYAEPATGGEAFIPRFGNPDRSVDILQKAARWYGRQVVAGTSGGSSAAGGITVERLEVQAWTDRFSLRQVEQELAMHGAV